MEGGGVDTAVASRISLASSSRALSIGSLQDKSDICPVIPLTTGVARWVYEGWLNCSSRQQSDQPTKQPTNRPTKQPTNQPTNQPKK